MSCLLLLGAGGRDAQRRVYVEEELAPDVVGCKLAKVNLVEPVGQQGERSARLGRITSSWEGRTQLLLGGGSCRVAWPAQSRL